MSINHTELFDSRANEVLVGSSSIELRYGVYGSEDEVEISEYVSSNILEIDFLGLPFQNWRANPVGGGIWIVTANYGSEVPRQVGDSSFTFEISNATRKITQSISTQHRGKVDGIVDDAPDLKGAIGVNGDTVDGVDIHAGTFAFSETHYFYDDDITSEYKINLARMTPSVNNAAFKGFQAGEVLFLGANGSRRGYQEWEITFRFAVQLNDTDIVFEGSEPFGKDGWDYFWVKYETSTGNNNYIKRPKYFYIERVYDRADFSVLGIGV